MKKRLSFLFLLVFTVFLFGCGIAALPLQMAISLGSVGLQTYSAIDTLRDSSGKEIGSINLEIDGPGIILGSDKKIISVAAEKGVGVTGDSESLNMVIEFTRVAEAKYRIFSPYSINRKLKEIGEEITPAQQVPERIEILSKVVQKGGMGGIFCFSGSGEKNKPSSMSRKGVAEYIYKSEVIFVADGRIAWKKDIKTTIKSSTFSVPWKDVETRVAEEMLKAFEKDISNEDRAKNNASSQ